MHFRREFFTDVLPIKAREEIKRGDGLELPSSRCV
jgi:hypothetical protein